MRPRFPPAGRRQPPGRLFAATRDRTATAAGKPLEVLSPHFESRAHSRIVNIPIDVGELWNQGGLSAPDPKEREKAVSLYIPWFDFAHAVGALSVRCDPGKINRNDLGPTVTSYRALAAHAATKQLSGTGSAKG